MRILGKFNIALVFVLCLLCVLLCGSALADDAEDEVSYAEAPVYMDGLLSCRGYVIGADTYVSLDAVCGILGYETQYGYDEETDNITVLVDGIEITVNKEDDYLSANGRCLYMPEGYTEVQGAAVFPLEIVAKIFTLDLSWNDEVGAYNFGTQSKALLVSAEEFYDEEDLYWLARIINAESRNQPLEGQIGVGNVVMNRVDNPRYPDSIKEVIFDQSCGTQFTPVENGSIYLDPSERCLAAAKLCLEGENTVGDALFFQQAAGGDNWIANNTRHAIRIADHSFYC